MNYEQHLRRKQSRVRSVVSKMEHNNPRPYHHGVPAKAIRIHDRLVLIQGKNMPYLDGRPATLGSFRGYHLRQLFREVTTA